MAMDFNHLQELIGQLETSDVQRKALDKAVRKLKKQAERTDFQLKRTLKDKSIAINLLNTSIENLTKEQGATAKANELLSKQKEEIEFKNIELAFQKKLVEQHSKEVEKSLEKLQHSYKELEQFSYIASHDLKSPLRTIGSYAQLLKRRLKGKLTNDETEFLGFILKGAEHMNNVICDLLEFSKVGHSQKLSIIDLNDVLELVKFNLKQEIDESGVEISHISLPKVMGHKTSMAQLLQNLMGNAIKFRNLERPLKLSIHCYEQPDKMWHFSVTDNGMGMDTTFQNKAFQPFQRVGHRDRPGTGMGLAICKKIITAHKGDIWFESIIGEGTTFHFLLPQLEEQAHLPLLNPNAIIEKSSFHSKSTSAVKK